ncbi:hypothetical protein BJ742DRAFT_768294 [Cladochytrium replicatum]|nr:hypothetical protein BJ742DRAFT_768294 [Cladochytrium replicatum]
MSTAKSDVKGRLGAGGKIDIFGASSIGDDIYKPGIVCSLIMAFRSGIEKYAVISGGSMSFGGVAGSIKNGGIAYGTNVTLNDAITKQFKTDLCRSDASTTIFDFASEFRNLKDVSSGLTALPGTGSVTTSGKDAVFKFSGSTSIEVFALSSTQLSSLSAVSLSGTPSSGIQAIVINVNGILSPDVQILGFNMSALAKYQTKVIWNFGSSVSTVKLESTTLEGMALMPYSSVLANSSLINGNMYGKSFVGAAEFQNTGFNGCLKPPTSTTTSTITKTATVSPVATASPAFNSSNPGSQLIDQWAISGVPALVDPSSPISSAKTDEEKFSASEKLLSEMVVKDDSLRLWFTEILPTQYKDSSDFPESQLSQNLDLRPHPEVKGDGVDANGVLSITQYKFFNWGATVKNTFQVAFFPRTVKSVQEIVKWSKANSLRVRCSGYRHTWSDFFGDNDQVLISFVFPGNLGPPTVHAKRNYPENQLHLIEPQFEKYGAGCFRFGAAVTNEMLLTYVLERKDYTIPINVIMTEITLGGSNAPICHGSGINSKTLSDLVVALEIVNVNGDVIVIDDPAVLKAAAGAFGVLGPVVNLVLKLDPMGVAFLQPRVAPKADAIPRVTQGPKWDRFVEDANKYYSEWFWFAENENCWINCWNKKLLSEVDPKTISDFPGEWGTGIQNFFLYVLNLSTRSFFKLLPGKVQAKLVSFAGMAALPNKNITTLLPNALHFQRGINNARVSNMEYEFRIPPLASDPTKPDFSICSAAWWATIDAAENSIDTPMRLAIEMRITRDSNILLAPQRGNTLGTCSVEFLTIPTVPKVHWDAYRQKVLDAWMKIGDQYGVPIRPHWAKEWMGLKVSNKATGGVSVPVEQYLKTLYSNEIGEFKSTIETFAAGRGFTFADCMERFSNGYFQFFFGDNSTVLPEPSLGFAKEATIVVYGKGTTPVTLSVAKIIDTDGNGADDLNRTPIVKTSTLAQNGDSIVQITVSPGRLDGLNLVITRGSMTHKISYPLAVSAAYVLTDDDQLVPLPKWVDTVGEATAAAWWVGVKAVLEDVLKALGDWSLIEKWKVPST